MSEVTYEDPTPLDRDTCSRFGAGAFPCGEPYKVRISPVSNYRTPGRDVARRRVLCRMHYEFDVAKVRGGAGGFKTRVKNAALDRLAGLYREDFQRLYEEELARLLPAEVPNLNAADLLPPKAGA